MLTISGRYAVTVRDKEGNLVREVEEESKSYVQAFLDLLYRAFRGVGTTVATGYDGVLDTGGTLRYPTGNSAASPLPMFIQGGANVTEYGSGVGSGTTVVSVSDYGLVTQIGDVTTTGGLRYGQTTFTNPANAGSTRTLTVVRPFTNNSGAAVGVRETGVYAYNYPDASGQIRYFCIIRDVLSGTGVSVSDGGIATLTYSISITA